MDTRHAPPSIAILLEVKKGDLLIKTDKNVPEDDPKLNVDIRKVNEIRKDQLVSVKEINGQQVTLEVFKNSGDKAGNLIEVHQSVIRRDSFSKDLFYDVSQKVKDRRPGAEDHDNPPLDGEKI